MPEFRFRDLFQHNGRTCLIVEREKLPEDADNFMALLSAQLFNNSFRITYCAYVESKKAPLTTRDFIGEELSEDVSFVGKFEKPHAKEVISRYPETYETFWIGFDSGLFKETSITNTYEYVKERLKVFCEELIEEGY